MSHPDSNIHPEATGPAKAVVDKHREEQPLKLYAGWFCPYVNQHSILVSRALLTRYSFVQRTWLALEEKKIPYQYIEVNPYHKPASLLSLNPRGLVPTLSCPVHDSESGSTTSKPLYESTVTLEYLEEAYPDHKPHFLPQDAYERARARIWIDYVGSRIIPSFHRFLQFQDGQGAGAGASGIDAVRGEFLSHLKEWTKEMHSDGPFFLGRDIGLPDLVLAPWAIRLWIFDEFKEGGLGIPAEEQGGDDEGIWSRWRKWLAAIEERNSIKQTTSERQFYLPIYKRYADNTAQSELAKATRAGRGVP